MSKPTLPRTAGTAQPAPKSYPLSEITITWPRRNHFEGDERRAPVTLSGERLGALVAYLADTAPGRLSNIDRVWEVGEVHRALEGLGEMLRIIGETDHRKLDTDFPAVCVFLADSVREYAARLGAAAGGESWSTDDAVVTIAPAAAPKAVAS